MTNKRDLKAEETREKILQVTADEMVRQGYQATGLSDIISALGLSKGAIYHHFANKQELGFAVIDEHLAKQDAAFWDSTLDCEDPIKTLVTMMSGFSENLSEKTLECGCPVSTLAEEMSPLDEGFRTRLEAIYNRRRRRITEAFLRAQSSGLMKKDVDAEETASFILATMQGAMGIAKNAKCCEVFSQSIKGLITYLKSLQP